MPLTWGVKFRSVYPACRWRCRRAATPQAVTAVCAVGAHAERRVVIALRAADGVAGLFQLNARDREIGIVGQHALDDFVSRSGTCVTMPMRGLTSTCPEGLHLHREFCPNSEHEATSAAETTAVFLKRRPNQPKKRAHPAGGEGIAEIFEQRVEHRHRQQSEQQAERSARPPPARRSSGWWRSPTPCEITSGAMPATSAMVVIRMGRRRSRLAWMMAS